MGRGFVAQFAVMSGEAELFDQSELAEQFRFVEDRRGKNFLVEEIQAPRPKPDQIDQKNRDNDNCDEEGSSQPLQNASKHGGITFSVSERRGSRWIQADSNRWRNARLVRSKPACGDFLRERQSSK